jgi:cytidylate kinase
MTRRKRPAVEFPEPETLPEWISRPDVITIEGPPATGKSSISAALCERYGYRYLHISAVARGLAVAFSEQSPLDRETALDADYGPAVREFYNRAVVGVRREGMDTRVRVNGTDVSDRLFTPETGELAAGLMRYENVQRRVAGLAGEFAAEGNIILDGRLVAATVAPEAELHIFLQTDGEERVRRRFEQRQPTDPVLTLEDVAAELTARDKKERAAGAHRPFGGSLIVDTTGRTVEESAGEIVGVYNALTRPADPPESPEPQRGRPRWRRRAGRSRNDSPRPDGPSDDPWSRHSRW